MGLIATVVALQVLSKWYHICTGDIVKYLFQQYGQGRNHSFGLLERYYIFTVLLKAYWFSFFLIDLHLGSSWLILLFCICFKIVSYSFISPCVFCIIKFKKIHEIKKLKICRLAKFYRLMFSPFLLSYAFPILDFILLKTKHFLNHLDSQNQNVLI